MRIFLIIVALLLLLGGTECLLRFASMDWGGYVSLAGLFLIVASLCLMLRAADWRRSFWSGFFFSSLVIHLCVGTEIYFTRPAARAVEDLVEGLYDTYIPVGQDQTNALNLYRKRDSDRLFWQEFNRKGEKSQGIISEDRVKEEYQEKGYDLDQLPVAPNDIAFRIILIELVAFWAGLLGGCLTGRCCRIGKRREAVKS